MTAPIVFIASGPRHWASARLRAYWVADRIEGAKIFTLDELGKLPELPAASAIVFQKHFNSDVAKHYRSKGAKVFIDFCDPLWWWQPDAIRKMVEYADKLVFCTNELAADFAEWLGDDRNTHVIPDRLDLSHYTSQRKHEEQSPVRLIWYGMAVNRIALFAALANLERLVANGHKIELTLLDDMPNSDWQITDMFPVYRIKWNLYFETEVIAAHDIALLPPYPGAWGRVKSDNKKLTAWACGLPVTTGEDYSKLEALVTLPEMRRVLGNTGRRYVEQSASAEQSAADWLALL